MAHRRREEASAFAQDAPLIAADVGGTHARIGLVGRSGANGALAIPHYRKYACADFPSLAAILAEFRRSVAPAAAGRMALAIAGVVIDDDVVNVKLPWAVSISQLRATLELDDLAVVNDFEAVAHAIGHVDAAEATLLSGPAAAAHGPLLIIGPGTGLGAALRVPHAERPLVLATEAGQATLAPDTALEFELLRVLRDQGERVQIEHVMSGPGLANLHAALAVLRGAAAPALTPAQVSAAALAGDVLARDAVHAFCGWFGAVLGDLVLMYGAQGGVYLAGGVLPQIRQLLLQSTFVERFLDKGAMREALVRTPVRLVDHGQLGVIGAASWYFSRDAHARVRENTGVPST